VSSFAEHCSTLTRRSHPNAGQAGLAKAFESIEQQVRAERSALTFDAEDFAKFYCERLPDSPSTVEALAGLRTVDLYLVWACLARQPAAISAFEEEVMPLVRRAMGGVDSAPGFIDEVSSAVRSKLLVATPGRAAGLNGYLGQGPLASFAMVVAMREAVDHKRHVRLEVTLDQVMHGLRDPGEGVESLAARREMTPHVQRALGEALASLTPRQRTLLRLHLVKGLSADRLARIYEVHRATTTRWISDARAQLLEQLTQTLQTRLKLGELSWISLKQKLVAGVDITLSGMLLDAESVPAAVDLDSK